MLCPVAVSGDDDIGEGFSDGEESRGHRAIIAGFPGRGEHGVRMDDMHERRDVDRPEDDRPEQESSPAPRSHYELPNKRNTSLRNIVWALGLTMLVVVLVAVGFFGVGGDQSRQTLPNSELDVAASAERAQGDAPFPVAVPAPGEQWTEKAARYSGGDQQWEIRYSSPAGRLVTMVQAPEISTALLSSTIPGAVVEEEREVEGVPCEVVTGGTDDEPLRGMSCTGEGWGLLVHGSAEVDELEELADAAITSARGGR